MSRTDRKSRRNRLDGQSTPADEPPAGDVPDHAEVKVEGVADTAPAIESPAPPPAVIESPAAALEPHITVREIPQTTSLEGGDSPMRAWPETAGERGAGFEVLIRRSALNAIHRHGQEARTVEICGVVVGNVYRDDSGPFLLIETTVRGNFAGNTNANVTFTAETWNYIQGVMDRQHPDQKIVGWYHTHPDHGIFLSDMDLFIHGHFFNMPWQVAFVYDPVTTEEGIFGWKNRKIDRSEFRIDEDADKELQSIPVTPEMAADALADFSRRMQAMQRRVRLISIGAVLLLLLAIVWPFVLITVLGDPKGPRRGTVPGRPDVPIATTAPVAVPTPEARPTTAPVLDAAALERALGGPVAPATAPAVAPTQPALPVERPPTVIRPTSGRGGAKVLSGPPDGQP